MIVIPIIQYIHTPIFFTFFSRFVLSKVAISTSHAIFCMRRKSKIEIKCLVEPGYFSSNTIATTVGHTADLNVTGQVYGVISTNAGASHKLHLAEHSALYSSGAAGREVHGLAHVTQDSRSRGRELTHGASTDYPRRPGYTILLVDTGLDGGDVHVELVCRHLRRGTVFRGHFYIQGIEKSPESRGVSEFKLQGSSGKFRNPGKFWSSGKFREVQGSSGIYTRATFTLSWLSLGVGQLALL
jgi:hypothetical protein